MRSVRLPRIQALLVLLAALCVMTPADARDKRSFGWLERVRLEPWGIIAKAKLDTGAKTSAIHATDIERFERDGKPMVRFRLAIDHNDADSETILVEKPLERDVTIKLRGTHKNDARPAVKIQFCLGGNRYEALFTLTNRSKFNYPVLLGRRFLADLVVVDPAEKHSAPPTCPNKQPGN